MLRTMHVTVTGVFVPLQLFFARTVASTHFAFGRASQMHMHNLNKLEGNGQEMKTVLPCNDTSP